MASGITRQTLEEWLAHTLQPDRFHDYCPNGLQVEGRERIRHIVTGVTASQALLEAAVAQEADAILVHHGWFWKNEDPRIRGPRRRRIGTLLAADISLFAYHLPLDAHPEWGNNAQLARVMDWAPDIQPDGTPRHCGPEDLVWLGAPAWDCTVGELAAALAHRLKRVDGRGQVVAGNGPVDVLHHRVAHFAELAVDVTDLALGRAQPSHGVAGVESVLSTLRGRTVGRAAASSCSELATATGAGLSRLRLAIF